MVFLGEDQKYRASVLNANVLIKSVLIMAVA